MNHSQQKIKQFFKNEIQSKIIHKGGKIMCVKFYISIQKLQNLQKKNDHECIY